MTIIPRFLRREEDDYEVEPAGFDWDPGAPQRRPLQQKVPKRFLTTLTLVSVFFGGAAFVAGAGDMAAKMIQKEDAQSAVDPTAAPDGSASADPSAADSSASDPS